MPRAAQQERKNLRAKDVDYRGNLRQQVIEIQQQYQQGWDQMRRSGEKGVQVDKAR